MKRAKPSRSLKIVWASAEGYNRMRQGNITAKSICILFFSSVVTIIVCFMLTGRLTLAYAQDHTPWIAGRFSFSDELGGFRITSVSGTGTREDPAVIRQVFDTAFSGTMIIRRLGSIVREKKGAGLGASHGTVFLRIETINNTNLSWVGFGFELQEQLNIVSSYGDGLSFDQISRLREDVYSNRFLDFEDQFEPGDRLVFTDGFVNNRTSVTTGFVITDFSPVREFYLLQDPQIPAS